LEIKAKILKILISELNDIAQELAATSSVLDNYAEDLKDHAKALENEASKCDCLNCSTSTTSGCGTCGDCVACGCSCSCSGDPCPTRAQMQTLKSDIAADIANITSTIPGILKLERMINYRRDEIRAFIFGADPTIDLWYYATSMDPRVTPSFMPFYEGVARLEKYTDFLKIQHDDLQRAEEKMKSPYGDRLTLMEFLRIKKEHSEAIVTTTQAYLKGRYDIAKYCREPNCASRNSDGVCVSCSTSTEGRLCGIKNGREQFAFDGDPATFYLNENYLEEPVVSKKEKCTIDQTKERGFPKGVIPIGQAVDEAEEFATTAISYLDAFYEEIISIRDNAIGAREQAFLEIFNVNKQIREITGDIYGVYDQGGSGRTTNPSTTTIDLITTTTPNEIDCAENMGDCEMCSVACSSVCSWYRAGCCQTSTDPTGQVICTSTCSWANTPGCCQTSTDPWSGEITCIDYTWHCICSTCSGSPCAITNCVTTYYNSSLTYYNLAQTNSSNISNHLSNVTSSISVLGGYKDDFIDAVASAPKVLQRCRILDKLNIARERLQKCLTGFSFASKEGKTKNRVFGARMGLHLEYSGKLVILPDFPIPAKAYNASACSPPSCLNAYPYNSEELNATERQACYDNKDSGDCWDAISDYLEDYYCCQWVP